MIGVFIDTQTFSVPTSSHKDLIQAELDLHTVADKLTEIKKKEMLYLFP